MAVVEVKLDDNFADGAIIMIEKRFRSPQTVYRYVAIKAKGRWYISGSNLAYNEREGMYPGQFLDWLLKGLNPEYPPRIYWAPEVIEI